MRIEIDVSLYSVLYYLFYKFFQSISSLSLKEKYSFQFCLTNTSSNIMTSSSPYPSDDLDPDRVLGLLLGLAAGDRNRGPTQMALALAESLVEENRYDPVRVFRRYLIWWNGGQGEDAWDTGPVAAECFAEFAPGESESSGHQTGGGGKSVSIKAVEETAEKLDRRLGGKTAGTNALHRVVVLACLGVEGIRRSIDSQDNSVVSNADGDVEAKATKKTLKGMSLFK